jgi:uncharacterized protein YicC (UPF0701 family)
MSAMTQQILFDRVRNADKLRESGVDENTVRAHADALDGMIDKRFPEVDKRFDKVDARLGKLEAKIDAVESRFDAKLANLKLKVMTAISESKQQLTWLIVGALVVQFTAKFVK